LLAKVKGKDAKHIPRVGNGGMSFVESSDSMGVNEVQYHVHWSLELHSASIF